MYNIVLCIFSFFYNFQFFVLLFLDHSCILQGIATVPWICFLYGMPSLYGTVVCIACGQLEKLRANLLEIRQKLGTLEQDSGTKTDREEGRQVQTSEEVFCRMQRQLNDCIRHHQKIIN
jgi:hypothetical protein